jgi:prepilin-type N-terminal cleavage/methylation domain-containing protein
MTGNNNKKKSGFAYLFKNRFSAAGFSLIEVLVSVALFSIIILGATSIFKSVIDSERGAIAAQNVEESLKYFSEVTGKEIRMAQKNSDLACAGIPATKIFAVTTQSSSSEILSFKNRSNQCVSYSLGTDASGTPRFMIQRGANSDFITPAKIKMDTLHFTVNDTALTQPIVTINLKAHALNQVQFRADMTIQTSITSRYYK